MSIDELTKIIEEKNRLATATYQETADPYWQGRRDLTEELLDMIEGERIEKDEIQN
jgi:hypothetical protein